MGLVDVAVEYNGENVTLPFLVVKGNGPPLLAQIGCRSYELIGLRFYTPSTGLQGLLE